MGARFVGARFVGARFVGARFVGARSVAARSVAARGLTDCGLTDCGVVARGVVRGSSGDAEAGGALLALAVEGHLVLRADLGLDVDGGGARSALVEGDGVEDTGRDGDGRDLAAVGPQCDRAAGSDRRGRDGEAERRDVASGAVVGQGRRRGEGDGGGGEQGRGSDT
ncbi:hypothetical protein [Streptomyces sp. NBC_01353]|uniref:hypothetical protein n=1 Tax=Streptomyces sp. NBC_01353 TaxID=2903835 RepID=UPI003DA30212